MEHQEPLPISEYLHALSKPNSFTHLKMLKCQEFFEDFARNTGTILLEDYKTNHFIIKI